VVELVYTQGLGPCGPEKPVRVRNSPSAPKIVNDTKTAPHQEKNPLLEFIDTDEYFADNSSLRRTAKPSFDFKVFDHLTTIITEEDQEKLKAVSKSLTAQEKELDPTIFKRELERFTVEFSWKSSQIEGNTYSLLETDVLIKYAEEAKGHSKEEATMILNHKTALDHILKNRQDFQRLTPTKIINLHQILTKDLGVTSGIRDGAVMIAGSHYMPLVRKEKIEEALSKTVEAINETSHPVAKALIAACMIAYIQPFFDGNKRTSRMLGNALLLAHDLYPLSYRSVEKINYIKAMVLFYEQNNLYHLKRIFLEQLEYAVNNYFLL
jgi:Fic family protein